MVASARVLRSAHAGVLGKDLPVAGAMTVLAVAVYQVAHAPRFNPPTYIDPWIYTASMWNFDYLYDTFYGAYYLSRLPWLLPGIALNSVFSHQTAYYVQHIVFALAGAGCAFLLIRRFYGSLVALVSYGGLLTSLLFYDAYTTDYPDGAQVTFLLAGSLFAFSPHQSRARRLRLVLAGFFLAAAVTTNLFDSIFVFGLALAYLIVFIPWLSTSLFVAVGRDAIWMLVGAGALVVVCGAFSAAHDGEFLFFMPSVRAINGINTADYKLATFDWLPREPRLLIPPFLVLAILFAWPTGFRPRWRTDPAIRFALGGVVFLTWISVIIGAWEFAGAGVFLQTSYYYTLFNTAFVLCTGVSVYLILSHGKGLGKHATRGMAFAALAAGALPGLWIYGLDRTGVVGVTGTKLTVVLMIVTLLLIFLGRLIRAPGFRLPLLLLVAVLIVFDVNVAGATSYTTQAAFGTRNSPVAKGPTAFALGGQFVNFMRRAGLQGQPPPAFWYDIDSSVYLNGIQSLYLWGYTQVGLDMPRVDAEVKRRLGALDPTKLVLLCATPDCANAAESLAGAGIRLRPVAYARLHAGDATVWVRAYTVPEPSVAQLERGYYAPLASPLSPRTSAKALRSWDFSAGVLPTGWAKSSPDAQLKAVQGGVRVVTDQVPSQFQLNSEAVELQPGTYAAAVDGRVDAGGLAISVLVVGKAKFLHTSLFWYGQRGFDRRQMLARFTLTRPTTVELVFWNWRQQPAASEWVIRRASLVIAR